MRYGSHDFGEPRHTSQCTLGTGEVTRFATFRFSGQPERSILDGMEILVARQPIFDRREDLYGYDLVLRRPSGAGLDQALPEQLVADTLLGIGIGQVAEGRRAFLTVDRDMLVGGAVRLLPADRVVLQLDGTIRTDPELLEACSQLVWSGYRFSVSSQDPADLQDELLRLAEIVKVDMSTTDSEMLPDLAAWLRTYHVRLLAMGVRHRVERDSCADLGFELFEGYRFNAPETLSRRDLPVAHVLTFKLLKLVRDPNTGDAEIEEVLRRDVALSYKLLRMVNSAAVGGGSRHLVDRARAAASRSRPSGPLAGTSAGHRRREERRSRRTDEPLAGPRATLRAAGRSLGNSAGARSALSRRNAIDARPASRVADGIARRLHGAGARCTRSAPPPRRLFRRRPRPGRGVRAGLVEPRRPAGRRGRSQPRTRCRRSMSRRSTGRRSTSAAPTTRLCRELRRAGASPPLARRSDRRVDAGGIGLGATRRHRCRR